MRNEKSNKVPERHRDRRSLWRGESEVDGLEQLVLRHHVSPVGVLLTIANFEIMFWVFILSNLGIVKIN